MGSPDWATAVNTLRGERFLVSSKLRPSRRLGGRDGNCDDVPLCVLSREMRVDVLTLALITAHIGHMPSIRLLA